MSFYSSSDEASFAKQNRALLHAMLSIPDMLDDEKEPAAVSICKSQEKRELGAEFDYVKQILPDFDQVAFFYTVRLPIFLFVLERFFEEILRHSKSLSKSGQAWEKHQLKKQNYY